MTDAILLVEDNEFDAKVFSRAVQGAGIDLPLTVANDGIEGLNVLRQQGATADILVITDLKMPRMGGIELLKSIRHTTEFAHLPVFVMTTSDLQSDRDEASALGIEGFILKSSDEQELIDPIVAYLAKQGDQAP